MGWLKRIFNRSESETTISAPAQWLIDAIGGGRSNSGIVVSRERALTYSAVYACINIISNAVAELPLHTFLRNGDGSKERAVSHPLYRALRYQANPETTAFQFRKTLESHVLLHGNGFALIERGPDGFSFWPIDPLRVHIERDRVSRELIYVVMTDNFGQVRLSAAEVLHIRNLSTDGVVGISTLHAARHSIGGALARSEYSERFFENSATGNVVIMVPPNMAPEMRKEFKKRWMEERSGLENAHKVNLLNSDMKVETLSISAKDSQLLESMQWSVEDVARWFNMPSDMLGASGKSVAYNGLSQANQLFLNSCLSPHLTNWEAELRAKCLTEEERAKDSVIIEFVRDAILRLDPVSQTSIFQAGIAAKYLTPNEVRGWLNLPPLEGGDMPVQASIPPQVDSGGNAN